MSDPSPDVRLTCRPGKSGNRLIFPYAVENHGAVAIYVADALVDGDHVNDRWVVVIQRGADEAVVGRYLAPLPPERKLPLIPLVVQLEPGGRLERTLEVPLPLAETSSYLPEPSVREYELVNLQAVVVAVSYWPADIPSLYAAPAEDAPGLLMIAARNPAGSARTVSQRFPTTGLQLFRRTDAFPRLA